jgi:hypothetical protein
MLHSVELEDDFQYKVGLLSKNLLEELRKLLTLSQDRLCLSLKMELRTVK